jgi:O-acetylserine/cysteine efflux transporter
MSARYALLGLLAALIWGGAFIVSADALKVTPPLFFAGLRFLAAAAFIVVIPRPAVSWPMLMSAGLLLGGVQYGLLFIGMANGVAPGIASLLVHTQIFFTLAFAAILLGERLNATQIAGIGVALAGLFLLASQRGAGLDPIGVALVVGAAVAGGAGNIILKKIGSSDRIGIAVWMSLAPPAPLFVASGLFEGNLLTSASHINGTVIGAVGYTAVLSTIVAFAIWAALFSTYPASRVSAFQLLVPVFGIALSVVFEGEVFTPIKAIAVALMFFGLVAISTPLGVWVRKKMAAVRKPVLDSPRSTG